MIVFYDWGTLDVLCINEYANSLDEMNERDISELNKLHSDKNISYIIHDYSPKAETSVTCELERVGNEVNVIVWESNKKHENAISEPTEQEMLRDYVLDVDFRLIMLELGF